ncbi:hypothetical protein BD770DRAFT_380167 [Pilaira anomala]|nr:hypothetical protein BD770DRAFT_380167 [Pilaira anomala]
MSEKYKNLKVKELQELLQASGIPHSGKKEDLIERLVRNDERKALENLEKEFELEFDASKLDDLITNDLPSDTLFDELSLEKPVIYEKESVLSDDDEDFLLYEKRASVLPKNDDKSVQQKTSPAVTAPANITTITEENNNNTNSSFKFTPITFGTKPTDTAKTTTTTTTTKTTTVKKTVKLAAIDPKLDEKKRQQIRAARFGITPDKKKQSEPKPTKSTPTPTTTTKTKSVATKVKPVVTKPVAVAPVKPIISEEILKKRAERFGLAVKEDEKKQPAEKKPPQAEKKQPAAISEDILKKRAERFGIALDKKKETTKLVKKPVDDFQERLKQRAERFGIPVKTAPEPKKKTLEPKKAPAPKKTPTPKKAPVKPAITKVRQGRIQKSQSKPVPPNKKAVTMVVTKNNVLNKKQFNINNRLAPGAINQNKRNIINNRKVNTINQKSGRIITIATPTISTKPVKPTRSSARNIIINPTLNTNGRTVTVDPNPVNTNNKRLRGRGGAPPPVKLIIVYFLKQMYTHFLFIF